MPQVFPASTTLLSSCLWCLKCCLHPHCLPVLMSQGGMSFIKWRAGNLTIYGQSAIMPLFEQAVADSRLRALQADRNDQQGAALQPAWSVAVRPLRVLQ